IFLRNHVVRRAGVAESRTWSEIKRGRCSRFARGASSGKGPAPVAAGGPGASRTAEGSCDKKTKCLENLWRAGTGVAPFGFVEEKVASPSQRQSRKNIPPKTHTSKGTGKGWFASPSLIPCSHLFFYLARCACCLLLK